MGNFKKTVSVFLRIGVSLLLLVLLLRRVDTKSLLDTISSLDKPLFSLALIFFSLTYILGLYRWEMLLKAVKIHIPFKRTLISFSGGVFFNA